MFKSVKGMSGNTQNGGACIDIYEIPEMPYYPQTITITYTNNEVGTTLSQRIIIMDCNGDDPTCEEYYNIDLVSDDANKYVPNLENENRSQTVLTNVDKIIYFDLQGNKLNPDLFDMQDMTSFKEPKIVIATYWDISGKFIESKKILIK